MVAYLGTTQVWGQFQLEVWATAFASGPGGSAVTASSQTMLNMPARSLKASRAAAEDPGLAALQTALGRDKLFRGPVEVAVLRSAWNDPQALFLAIKAGHNQVNHGHLDLGSFELDALGVRWVRDLGADNYNLPGYWDRRPGGRRWSYYRLNSHSHRVPLLDDKDQHALAKARIVKFRPGAGRVPLRARRDRPSWWT